jgi:hypothetical protein
MKNKLFRYSILSLTFSLACLAINPPAATGQSISYICQPRLGSYATVANTSLGSRPIITWDDRQPICDIVSRRFQIAGDNGNLRFLVREENRICGTNIYDGECRSFLFSTDTPANAQGLLRGIVNGNTNPGRYITQSSDGSKEYFNLELYLQENGTGIIPTDGRVPLPN